MHLYLMCARAQAWHGLPTVLHVQFQVVESLKRKVFQIRTETGDADIF